MNPQRFYLILFGLLSTSFFACKKKTTEFPGPGPVSVIPKISLLSVSATTVHQFTDSIQFTLSFVDGDGDLGDESADSLSLYLTDNRQSGLTERYHLNPIAPSGVSVPVNGVIPLTLHHTILLNSSSSSETTTFTLKLKDRAGHWSNEVSSNTITILP